MEDFVKADPSNLPQVELYSILQFLRGKEEYSVFEERGKKANSYTCVGEEYFEEFEANIMQDSQQVEENTQESSSNRVVSHSEHDSDAIEDPSLPREKLGTEYVIELQIEDDEFDRKRALFENKPEYQNVDNVESTSKHAVIENDAKMKFVSSSSQQFTGYYLFLTSPSDLIINSYKQWIVECVNRYPVNIIKGPTGCGKTTQVPQFILDDCLNQNIHCNIVVTQPRRMATISLAKRVCQERKCQLGSLVGYQVGLDKIISEDTRLMYCTTGVLLKQFISTKDLSVYSHIIVDEVNERDSETDFLLSIIKMLMRINEQKTKIILLSAPINTDKFSNYFSQNKYIVSNGAAPVTEIKCSTRYDVSIFYLESLNKFSIKFPSNAFDEPKIHMSMYEMAARLIDEFHPIDVQEHHKTGQYLGSVIIFLPGFHEIETMTKILREKKVKEWEIYPLHSAVPFEEQSKVFKLSQRGNRKIIISTNIAESCITVPDVKYVIDFCLTKIRVHDPNTNYSQLQLSWISKNQGIHRQSRVGRFMPGRVYRLIPENIYQTLPEELTPELLRCPLHTLVLKSKQLNMGSPTSILGRALDPPNLSSIHRAVLDLKTIGALLVESNGSYKKDDGDITLIGHIIASLPLDPHLSKLIILGHMFGCLKESIIMACAMSVKDYSPSTLKNTFDAYTSKLAWSDGAFSDPIALLNIYLHWKENNHAECAPRREYFVHNKFLQEVFSLEIEVKNRLRNFNMLVDENYSRGDCVDDDCVHYDNIDSNDEDDISVNGLPNEKKECLLKVILAGAAYPNYFTQKPVDDKDTIKLLGGRNPHSTVYMTNFPLNQPGPLYVHPIKEHFKTCGSGINVHFDRSPKVYITFETSVTCYDDWARMYRMYENGQVMTAVYKAIKIRKLHNRLTLPILNCEEAQIRAKAIFGNDFDNLLNDLQRPRKCPTLLPASDLPTFAACITHIASPSSFWVNINMPDAFEKSKWLFENMQNLRFLTPLTQDDVDKGVEGKICAAPYPLNGKLYNFRAKIISITSEQIAKVLFIDYGNNADIDISQLYLISEEGHKIGLSTEPGRAIQCSLVQVKPNLDMNPNGVWSKLSTSEFFDHYFEKDVIVWIYSVTNSVLNVHLYIDDEKVQEPNCSSDISFNHYLIRNGFAKFSNESYQSLENHKFRMSLYTDLDATRGYPFESHDEVDYADFEFESPSYSDCHDQVDLSGPFSPLESGVDALQMKSKGLRVAIDRDSVNSVLLDTTLTGKHRLVVASSVSQTRNSDILILWNTTLMPADPGLYSIIPMIFAPRIELRSNDIDTYYIGALCGLGCDEKTGVGYYQENDMEVIFDTQIDQNDIDNVNKLRYWMNYLINLNLDQTRSGFSQGRRKLQKQIIKLLTHNRNMENILGYDDFYKWKNIEKKCFTRPFEKCIFVLIPSIKIEHLRGFRLVSENLETLRLYADEVFRLRNGITCLVCRYYLENVNAIKYHLQSSVHLTNCCKYYCW